MSEMVEGISVNSFFGKVQKLDILDVRSPGEFEKGHIPGALNMPLFSDEERAEVGTLYKRKNKEKAYERGLEIVGPKMADFVRTARKFVPSKKMVIHCWRGGQRSKSMAWLLSNSGFSVNILEGGYKAYKSMIRKTFEDTAATLLVLGGKTGAGKTDILLELKKSGEQVIDLEGLANHKGSAFGAFGQPPQPTTEQFENDLFEIFRKMDITKRIWLENESRTIGTVYLPDSFLYKMKSSILVNIDLPLQMRVKRLVKEYSEFSKARLIDAFERIERRLGGQNLKLAREAISQDNYFDAAETALRYYDKTYLHAVNRWSFKKKFELELKNDDPAQAALDLIKIADGENL